MKKTLLGKLLFLLLITPAFAANNAIVQATVDKTQFYLGDVITLTINAKGKSIKFPNINKIAGYRVTSRGSSSSVEINNFKKTSSESSFYLFEPNKSFTIPAFNLQIDGKNQKTSPIKITLLKPNQNKSGDDLILSIKADKTEFFVGEKVGFQVVIKHKKSISLSVDPKMELLQHKILFFESDKNFIKSADANYIIYTKHYQAIAYQAGTFKINPITVLINNSKKIHSNLLQIKVKSLPDNLYIYGSFDFKTVIDKSQLKAGEALNLTLKITGKGNLTDIEKFPLNIENATIYSDEPKVKNQQWTQKIAIIAQNDFIIPSFDFDFFDKQTGSKKTLKTQPIKIQVIGEKISGNFPTQSKPFLQSNSLKYYYLLSGILIGMLIVGLIFVAKRINRVHKNQDLIKQIKNTRGDKALFDLLLPLNKVQLKSVLQQLEGNLYKNQNNKINKKHLMKILKAL